MNEEQTRQSLINPKLRDRGWTEDLIQVERTPGGADIIDGRARKRKGRTDYLLSVRIANKTNPVPIALIEAKKESEYPALGLQQARRDGRLHHVPFVFSTNGNLYTEYGEDTGQIRNQNLRLEDFPTPDDLRARWEAFTGLTLGATEAKPMIQPYKGGQAARWYFQDAAIRAALEKIAKHGDKWNRVLISMATGTGKTILAAQLLYKLKIAGQLKRALFVCDRDELRSQGMAKMFALFGDNARIVDTSNPQATATVLIATYQTLNISEKDAEPLFWKENYPPGTFSHIIIDECHRSAFGQWGVILRDNPDAVHIGLTATPRIIKGGKADNPKRQEDVKITNDNIEYFGEPVYEYLISDGQDDGYLAQMQIIRRSVDLDKETITREDIVERSGRDAYTGRVVDPDEIDEEYTREKYEKKLLLDDRVQAMCEDLFALLLETGGPNQKTIIFCASDNHAIRVTSTMSNIYEAWCRANGVTPREMYVFQCTGNPNLRPPARETIKDFRDSKSTHFVATTVNLLSTGVDIPDLDNVVFFQYLESPIEFYQRVGRGTRTGSPPGSKMLFRLYDYTNATRLFGQPFESKARPEGTGEGGGGGGGGDERERPPLVRVMEGKYKVEIQGSGRAVYVDDRAVPEEEYKQMLAERVQEQAPTVDDLRERWVEPAARQDLLEALPGGESAARFVRELNDQLDCDLYDVLAELTYGMEAKSRGERAASFTYKHRKWLHTFPEQASQVLTALAGQFEKGGIDELETPYVWDADEVRSAGGLNAIQAHDAAKLVHETKVRLLAP